MVRVVLYLFLAIILITFLRSVIGILGKAFSAFFVDPRPSEAEGPRNAGELKRDPVCGTYVSPAASVTKTVGGEVVHFCSQACCDKYRS